MEDFKLYGVKIDNVTLDEAVYRSLRNTGEPCVVFTPNALMLERCRRDAALAELLNYASLSLADGAGVERKTLERHRRYLVAVLLICTNGYEIMRGHIMQVLKGGEG